MAQLTIGIGSSANDGTGDPLRTAFTKINTNFTELYGSTAEANDLIEDTTPQLGGNLDLNGWNITSARSNEDVVLSPAGTGGVIASAIRLQGTTISADDSSLITIGEAFQVNGATNIDGAVTATSTLGVTGATTLSSTLAVSGATTLTTTNIDNINIYDNYITSDSNADINITAGGTGNVVVGSLTINGTAINSADSSLIQINEALNVSGATDIAGAFTGTSGAFSTTLAVSGATTLTTTNIDNINIYDNYITSDSNADINITAGGTGNVIVGSLTINGTAISSADSSLIQLNEAVNISGATDIAGALTTIGQTITGTVAITGQADIDYVRIIDNKITTNASNAILEISANGSGVVNIQNAMTTIGQTVTGTVSVTGQLNADNLRFDGNAITSTDSNGAITITPDGTGQITLGGNYVAVTNELAASDVAIASELLMGAGSKIVSNATNEDLTLATNGTGVVTTASQVTLTGSFLPAIHTFAATDAITTIEHAGRTCLLGEVGGNALVTLTLPDATGSGATYKFIVTVVNSSSYVIKVPDANNTIDGIMLYLDEDGTAVTGFPTVAASDTITINGGTTGGQIGDYLELVDIATDQWHVRGVMRCLAGVDPATCFSATVS